MSSMRGLKRRQGQNFPSRPPAQVAMLAAVIVEGGQNGQVVKAVYYMGSQTLGPV